jgi:hypothetical protein
MFMIIFIVKEVKYIIIQNISLTRFEKNEEEEAGEEEEEE